MTVPVEQFVELVSALARDDRAGAQSALGSAAWNWQAFARFAAEHRVAGFVWKRLAERSLAAAPPPAAASDLRATYVRQWTKNERLRREARRIKDRLEAGDIPHLFLKGPFFAERFYGDLDARAISDLDLLLFDRRSLFAAEAVVESLGYRRVSQRPLGHRLTSRFTHHYTYRRGDLAVELHWAFQSHYSFRIDYPAVRRRSEIWTTADGDFPVTSAADELTLQILSAFTDAQVGEFRLRTALDLHQVLRHREPAIDWDAYLAELRAARISGIGANVLAACVRLLRCDDEFPRLGRRLAGSGDAEERSWDDAWRLLVTRRLDPAAKLRSFRMYDAALPGCILWWAVSLPVRVGVYR